MGYYTKFNISCTLRKDLPDDIRDLLICLIYGQGYMHGKWPASKEDFYLQALRRHNGCINLPDHPLFKMDRWPSLFSKCGFTDLTPRFAKLCVGRDDNLTDSLRYHLHLAGEINYGMDVVLAFANWISAYVAGHKPKQYIGYSRTEGMSQQINIYVDKTKRIPL